MGKRSKKCPDYWKGIFILPKSNSKFQHSVQAVANMLFREEGDALRAIVYYPKMETAQKELIRRVSKVHAEFVLDYIKHLRLQKEQSEKVIAEVCEIIKNKQNLEYQ